MSTLSPKDRVSLCTFTFADGRRCLSPRTRNHPRFCPYHAQKAARARNAKKLGKDLTYFFSGNYLSACDLSTALASLIPAVVRGDLKPRTAHTVAYLAQTLMQAIHLSKHEYINAFGTDAWRQSVRNSVNHNHDYRIPPAPQPELSASPRPSAPVQPQPQPQPAQPKTQPPVPAATASPGCPPERSEGPNPIPTTPLRPSAAPCPHPFNLSAPAPSAIAPQPPAPHSAPSSSSCHAERSEASQPIPSTPAPIPAASAAQHNNPPSTPLSTPAASPNRDAPWLNWDPNRRLPPDSHLL